jgi:hypothetical protein
MVLIVEVLIERVVAGPAKEFAERILIAIARGEVFTVLTAQLTDGDAHTLLEFAVGF